MLNSPTWSNNNNNTTSSPIFYVNNILSYLDHDHYPSDNYSTSYYHLPSPLVYNEINDFVSIHDLEFIQFQQSYLANNSSILTEDSSILEVDHNNKVDDSNKGDDEVNGIVEDSEMDHHKISSNKNNIIHGGLMKKKRTSNKDRHSKIRTAHGLRDRRMRLSLQVARPFFRLQDMLGFDKASRTVEWLMIQSKSSIEEIIRSKHGSPSGVTKCTTISSTSDDCEVDSTTIEEQRKGCSKEKRVATCSARKDELMKRRKRTTKEERKVARERAKKRTLERKQSRGCQVNYNNNSSIKERNNHYVEVGEDNHHIIDDNVTRNWSPLTPTTLNHHQQSFEACHQNVPSYTISTQRNMVEGPQK